MPDDIFADGLSALAQYFANRGRQHGGLRAPVTRLENAALLTQAALHFHDRLKARDAARITQESVHPLEAMFQPFMSGTPENAALCIRQFAELHGTAALAPLADGFADYLASLADSAKRRHAASILLAFGQVLAGPDARPAMTAGRAGRLPRAEPEPERLRIPHEPPPHPSESFFAPYMNGGPGAGADKVAAVFSGWDRATAAEFFRAFIVYAVTLRSDDKLKTAFALSNRMFLLLQQMPAGGRLALAFPARRQEA